MATRALAYGGAAVLVLGGILLTFVLQMLPLLLLSIAGMGVIFVTARQAGPTNGQRRVLGVSVAGVILIAVGVWLFTWSKDSMVLLAAVGGVALLVYAGGRALRPRASAWRKSR